MRRAALWLWLCALALRLPTFAGIADGRQSIAVEAIDGALRLKPLLDRPDADLGEACASLPEALAAPRYDLARYYQEKLKQ